MSTPALGSEGYRWNNGWPWTWGLMLRKWFEHSGGVDLARIAEFIDAYDTFWTSALPIVDLAAARPSRRDQ
ncbi:hypothetical protein F5882DRAFT_420028 [Hyaloscypha sp. PMI_1271]|nr:hypothetical protein F5882DRAFT_420028 [Hyaloscypha sp. PMI_1271]